MPLHDNGRALARARKAASQARWRARRRGENVPRLKPGPKPRRSPEDKEAEMRRAELEEAVAELLVELRRALLAVNHERSRRRPKGAPYTSSALGREDLLRVERDVEIRKGGAS